ncbi:uncharacterized protein LOC128235441 [Mya arenaria]|uniref:uncharacterized protein LOC128235441 n=1 Tax=Mya arenaria TaxID=6604 RepID=UPI0022DEA0AE|nr:uncharacterized protein LOC128235441 [Mya arenaria]
MTKMKYIFLALLFGKEGLTSFIRYEPGFEYLYDIDAIATLHDVDTFQTSAKIGFQNIHSNENEQEIRLHVESFIICSVKTNECGSQNEEFSKWFSFLLTPRGEINQIYYEFEEDSNVLAIKKGFVDMLSCKLHHMSEVEHEAHENGWKYQTMENGKEGRHNSNYYVNKTDEGYAFHKTRVNYTHSVKGGSSSYQKKLTFHSESAIIETVKVEENLTLDISHDDGFDPYKGMRPSVPVGSFNNFDMPQIQAHSKDDLIFTGKRVIAKHVQRPQHLTEANISDIPLKNVRKNYWGENATEAILSSLECLRKEPERGSHQSNICFKTLVNVLDSLEWNNLKNITDCYLKFPFPRKCSKRADQNHFADAVGSLKSDHSIELIANILTGDLSPERIIDRILTAISASDINPSSKLLDALRKGCTKKDTRFTQETRHSFCFAFGGLIGNLHQNNKHSEANEHIQYVHRALGLHDPWEYRRKRSFMSESECIEHDLEKVVLLETLGNAGLSSSYEYIASHINSTNSQWVKRAGIFALRSYHDKQTMDTLHKVAISDEEEVVRYEAVQQYQSHPLTVNSMDTTNVVTHDVSKRSIFDKSLAFKLEAPGVDWRKQIGSKTIGASFGLIMENLLDLQVSLLKGSIEIRVHDEAYGRVHLGFLGGNFDFFVARICFKGGAKYNLNILKDLDIENIFKMFKQFVATVKNVISAIRKGVSAFQNILNSDGSIKAIVERFVDAIEELPDKVSSFGERIQAVIRKISVINVKKLPSFIIPVKQFVDESVKLYERVRSDVMTFYNTIADAIQIKIPQSAEQIFEAVQGIINGFMDIFSDVKTSLFKIGKGVLMIWINVKQLNETLQDVKSHTFISGGMKQYFFDLNEDIGVLSDMFKNASNALVHQTEDWINEAMEGKDIIATFTNGTQTMGKLRQRIVSELLEAVKDVNEPLNSLLNIGGNFIKNFVDLFDSYNAIKSAFQELKQGYEDAKSMVTRILGTKCHRDFPKTKRESGGGCDGDGFYPARLQNGGPEYTNDGIDIIIDENNNIVAPFAAKVYLSENENEVILSEIGSLPSNSEIIITNVKPLALIKQPSDEEYVETYVAGGDTIGFATASPCNGFNHIHLSLRRDDGLVDPSDILDTRPLQLPKWTQVCDDYKLVYKGKTIKAGFIVGTEGRKEEDTSQTVPTDGTVPPEDLAETQRPGTDIDEIKGNPNSLYNAIETGGRRRKRDLKGIDSAFKIMLENIKLFLKKLKIRQIKMGAIIDFLEELGLEKTKQGMADLMKIVKDSLDNEGCNNPDFLTDDELEAQLQNRGLQPKESREEMIEQLREPDNKCPLMTLSMPDSKMLYCTMDDQCLGIECCMTIDLFDILAKTFKAFIRYDPDVPSLTFGFEDWVYEIAEPALGGDEEQTVKTDIKFDFLDENNLILKYAFKIRQKNLKVTFGVGICNPDDLDDCFAFFYVLKDAIFPYPTVNADGSLTFPKIDWNELFKDTKDAFDDSVENIVEKAIDVAVDEFLEALHIDPDLLANGPLCKRPERFEDNELISELKNRQLSTDGARHEMEERLEQDDLTCTVYNRTLTLPKISNDILYYYIQNDCLRIEACVDIAIPLTDYTKSFRAFISLDPCNYVMTAAFEKWSTEIILFDYEWGKDEIVKLTEALYLKFNIDKLDDEKVFLIDFGIKFDDFIDQDILTDFKVEIPICNDNFTLLGNLKDLANALGGELSRQAFELLLQQLGIKDILLHDECILPEPPTGCPPTLDISNAIPESLDQILRCQLSDDCFGIRCCIDLTFQIPLSSVQISVEIPVWFDMDPCEFTVRAGIADKKYSEQLLQYNWETPSTIHIGKPVHSPIEITYSVGKYEDGFILNLNLTICIPIDEERFCIPQEGLSILDNEKLPACNLAALANFTEFSLDHWLQEKGYDLSSELSEAGAQALFLKLGLSEFLKSPSCDRSREPYMPSINGWSNVCPLTFERLPVLPDHVSCHIPNHCTGIDCCMRIPSIGLSLNVFFSIDMCNYVVTGGIEKHTFEFTLFDYEWGKDESVSILNFLRMTYSIKKIDNEKKFIINLKAAVCLDSTGNCLFEQNVLENSEVPQLGCDLEFNFKNFSTQKWLADNGIGDLSFTDVGWDDALELLFQVTGMDKYFLTSPCTTTVNEQVVNDGWINECPANITYLPQIDNTVCRLNTTCTAFDCCFYIPFLKRTIQVALNIDFCKFEIYGNLETLSFNLSIFDYEWGSEHFSTILEMIQLKYKIDKTEKHFIVDMSLAVCMDSDDKCQLNQDIFVNKMLPIPICNTDSGYSLKNFSMTEWTESLGFSPEDILSAAAISTLLKELDLDKYLLSPECTSNDKMYATVENGWRNECGALLRLPILPKNVVCHIPDFCTGIECCIGVDIIRRSFNTKLVLNACDLTFTIGIEKLSKEISLTSYNWGTVEEVSVGGVIKIVYSIEDLQSEKTFVVNVNVKVCFEENYCLINEPLLTNVYLPKPLCNWDTGYIIPDYSLSSWLSEHSLDINGDVLESFVVEKLLNDLGIAKYLRQNQCNIGTTPFLDAWNNDCPKEIQARTLPSFMSCHIVDYCTGIECCIDVSVIQRSLRAYIFLNACDYKLEIGIENYALNISLLSYSWGKWDEFSLLGIFRIRYRIINLEAEKRYVVDLKMALCIQSNTCEEDVVVLKEADLPKPGCDWTGELPNIKLDDFRTDLSINSLPSYTVDIILEKLGILKYMSRNDSCTLSSDKYNPATDGWKNDCEQDITMSLLSNHMRCNIQETCTTIDCCISVPVMERTFKASIDLDACDLTLTLSFEKYEHEIALLNYEWGTPQVLNIQGVFHLHYTVEHLPSNKQFRLSASLKLCIESSGCIIDQSIADNVLLPIPFCSFDGSFKFKNFSVTEWIKENTDDAANQVIGVFKDMLLDDLGLTNFLSSKECSVNREGFALNGWRKECTLDRTLPSLPESMVCALGENCFDVSCCVLVPIIDRTLSVKMKLDFCEFELYSSIENLSVNYSLISYPFGTSVETDLVGVLRLKHMLLDDTDNSAFRFSLDISVCLESNGPCVLNVNLLNDVRVPKPLCDLERGFRIPDFALDKWLADQGLSDSLDMTEIDVSNLIETLGISKYLDDQTCEHNSRPFHGKGWTTDCPLHIIVPDLPDAMQCYLQQTCTGVECCIYVDVINRYVSAQLQVDTCNMRIIAGIENLLVNESLIDYSYGTEKHIYLMGVFRMSYMIRDYAEVRELGIDLEISVCFTENSCDYSTPIFVNKIIPKPLCKWDSSFLVPDFSLENWLTDLDISDVTKMAEEEIQKLTKDLGISSFLSESSCEKHTYPYDPVQHGWNSECTEMQNLQSVPPIMSCYISEDCSTFSCCVEIELLKRTVETMVKIDFCNFLIEAEIDRLKVSRSFIDYEFGTELHLFLFGVVRLTFQFFDSSNTEYVANLAIQVCFEAKGTCLIDAQILSNVTIPKLNCLFGTSFYKPGFQISEFFKGFGIENEPIISDEYISQLFSVYDIEKYIKDEQCTKHSIKEKHGCSSSQELRGLPSDSACVYFEDCLSIVCCVQVPFVNRHFELALQISTCEYYMQLSVENYSSSILLDNTQYGTWKVFQFQGMTKLRYRLIDIYTENSILIDIRVQLCLSDGTKCELDIAVMDSVKVAKPLCGALNGFKSPDFSLVSWLNEINISDIIDLPDIKLPTLYNALGIDRFLRRSPCKINDSTRNLHFETNDKSSKLSVSLCLHVEQLDRTILTEVELDHCNFELKFAIENYERNFQYSDFKFGTKGVLDLFGIFTIRYDVTDLKGFNQFSISLEYRICFEAHECPEFSTLVSDYRIAKPNCSPETFLEDISMENVLSAIGYEDDTTLSPYQEEVYLHMTKLATFMETTQCALREYDKFTGGWLNMCPTASSLPVLTEGVSCTLDETCKQIKCCVHVPFLNRNVIVAARIDPCENLLLINVDKFVRTFLLSSNNFGINQQFSLFELFNVTINVKYLSPSRSFILDMDVNVCLQTGSCDINTKLLDGTRISVPSCNFTTGFLIEDFSLNNWASSSGISDLSEMSQLQMDSLFEDLDISRYYQACTSASGHDTEKCDSSLLISTNGVNCYFEDACTNVTCCVDLSPLNTSIQINLDILPCALKAILTIGTFQRQIPLVNMEDMESIMLSLGGFVKSSVTIRDLSHEQSYLVDLSVTVCTESNEQCILSIKVFENALLPKDTCNWSADEYNNDFSILTWTSERGLVLGNFTDVDSAMLLDRLQMSHILGDGTCPAPTSNGCLLKTTEAVQCALSETCLRADCCIHSKRIATSFQFAYDIDICNFKAKIQIEKLVHTLDLFTYDFGTSQELSLFGLLTLRYSFDMDVVAKSMRISLIGRVCLDKTTCDREIVIANNTVISLPSCEGKLKNTYGIEEFSLSNWLTNFNTNKTMVLPDFLSTYLLDQLGISYYLEENRRCPHVSGSSWNKDVCPQLTDVLPSLPDTVKCSLTTCTSASCCYNSSVAKLPIHFSFDVDPCELRFDISLEKLTYSVSLVDYNFGNEEQLWIGGVFRLRFRLYDILAPKRYVAKLYFDICWERHECETIVLLNNTVLLTEPCNYTSGFASPDFSLTSWKEENGIEIDSTIPENFQKQLIDDLDITNFLQEDTCTAMKEDVQGCPLHLPLVDDQLKGTQCQLLSHCTGVRCCMTSTQTGLNFEILMDVDPCTQMLTMQIENYKKEIPLHELQYGTNVEFWLQGVVRMRFYILELKEDRSYIMTLEISLCFEANSSCEFNYSILNETKLPKFNCEWGPGLQAMQDFSISQWLDQMGIMDLESADDYVYDILFTDLGIAEFLREKQCLTNIYPFTEGTNNECIGAGGILPSDGPVHCHITTSCQTIECCTDVDVLHHAFYTYLSVDICNMTLSVGIEQYVYTISLVNYQFGALEHFWLQEFARMDFRVYNIESESSLVVNLDISFCLDTSDCHAKQTVLSQAQLPYTPCKLDEEFSFKGFSWSSWLEQHNLIDYTDITPMQLLTLSEQLQLSKYLLDDEECTANSSGNDNGCLLNNNTNSEVLTCALPSCLSLGCCINFYQLHHVFRFAFNIDNCNQNIHIALDKFSVDISLLDFQWNSAYDVFLKGVVRISFRIEDLEHENAFLVSLSLRLCLEDEECFFETTVFNNMLAPKAFCDYSVTDIYPIKDFSLVAWMSDQDITGLPPLSQAMSTILLDSLGVSNYLGNSCDQSGSGSTSSVPFQINFGGILRFEYSINNLAYGNAFLVNALLKTCFESSLPCVEIPLLSEAIFEKPVCSYDLGFAEKDFSLQKWLSSNGILQESQINSTFISKLYDKLNLSPYLLEEQCPFNSSQTWSTDCEFPIDVQQLPNNINCHLDQSCTSFTCCVDISTLQRTFLVKFRIDSCENKVERSIEKYRSAKYLFNYNWGETETMSLFGVIRQRLSVDNLEAEKKFIVNFGISICLESDSHCLLNLAILTDATIPKTLCDWNSEFLDKDFDYLDWRHENNVLKDAILSQNEIDVLMDELGVTPYLTSNCQTSNKSTDDQNWLNDCPMDISLPTLPEGTQCMLRSDCFFVECCTYLDFIRHDIHTRFHLEPCTFLLNIELEKLSFTINLFEFEFGEEYILRLYGVFALRFKMQDLSNSGFFVIDISLEICQGTRVSCTQIHVFEKMKIPKPTCDLGNGFKIPSFSLETWKTENGVAVEGFDPLSLSQLYEYIGIAPYLQQRPCKTNQSKSWTSVCPNDLSLTNLTESVSCSIGRSCADVRCCLYSQTLQRTFTVEMSLDACVKKLNLAIEQLYMNISLYNFEWGQVNTFSMFGVVRLGYTIDYLELSNVFIASLNVSVCLEADSNCEVNFEVLSGTILPIQPCDLDTPYKIPDFSLTHWLEENRFHVTSVLDVNVVSDLFEILGITSYLQTNHCSPRSDVYAPGIQGWRKECGKNVHVPDLHSDVACLLTDSCNGISCCLTSHLVGRSFEVAVDLDHCEQTLHLRIEKLAFDLPIDNIELGVLK